MDENNKKVTASEKDESKKEVKKGEKVSLSKKIAGKWGEYKGEFKKIIWPDRKALVKHTVNVIITSLAVGAVIIVLDYAFSSGYSLLIGLFQ